MERSASNCARFLSRRWKANRASIPANRAQCVWPSVRHSSPAAAPSPPVSVPAYRCLHTSSPYQYVSRPPKSRDRGPKSDEETQTDFSALDVLRNTAAPATAIDACTSDGFALNNQVRISGSGIMLVGGQAFRWRPWVQEGRREGTIAEGATGDDAMTGRLLNTKGQWDVPEGAWGVLELVYPKPDLLIIGTGSRVTPIAPSVRKYLNGLGMRLEIQDTRNAAAQFNLLATERGVGQVAAALIPVGWKEGR